ncbi:FAD-dependent thymidylate synthase [Acetatifactor muris]|uniref:FAD-dependent thymidylate synthase n=1 Tax=Acetatifactor muris TaxID=879566 RepID=A0A2K4ZAR3_9FIRM|nr:FAD-dependent thymidylate synthase [Acetatifactor muris]MCR2048763.1 FAD-dependent thymidylate synthase [Acetatifactor muris]SOY27555.1 FAD-dependent thymidylate synthase [Acetatifactor muris]
MITILSETTKNPITLMGERAGVCWGADIRNAERNYKRGLDCIKSGHHRVMEYVNVEMILEGYSARVIREWYTHIGGAPTRLQASTRYINYKDFSYITPPSVAGNPEAERIYRETMETIAAACERLESSCGIPREDAAMLLPLGMSTKIVDKRNVRNLIEMSHQRLCTRAYWEYRGLMQDICRALSEYSEEWKYLTEHYFVPKCDVAGYCTEKKSCGRTKVFEPGADNINRLRE